MGLTGDAGKEETAATAEDMRKQRGIAKGKVTRKLSMLTSSIGRGDPPEMLKDMYGEVNSAFEQLEIIGERYMQCLVDENQITEAELYLSSIEK